MFRQAQHAEQHALKAQQRAAVLAASASRSFTEEGALDQALLLMLDTAHLFDDVSVPDEIRITFSDALKKEEITLTKTLFPKMQVFETEDALLPAPREAAPIDARIAARSCIAQRRMRGATQPRL